MDKDFRSKVELLKFQFQVWDKKKTHTLTLLLADYSTARKHTQSVCVYVCVNDCDVVHMC